MLIIFVTVCFRASDIMCAPVHWWWYRENGEHIIIFCFLYWGWVLKYNLMLHIFLMGVPWVTTQKYLYCIIMGNIFISWFGCNSILLGLFIGEIVSYFIIDTFIYFKFSLVKTVLTITYFQYILFHKSLMWNFLPYLIFLH